VTAATMSTRTQLLRLLSFFDRRGRFELAGLFVIVGACALLEMAGIALVLPLTQLVLTPEKLRAVPAIGAFLQRHPVEPRLLLPLMCGGLFAFYAVKNAILFAINWLQTSFVTGRTARFSEEMYAAYLCRPYLDHLKQNSAEILNNVVFATSTIFNNGVFAFLNLVLEALMLAAVGLILLLVDPWGTVIAAAFLGGTVAALYLSTRHRIPKWSARTHLSTTAMIKIVNESLAAVKEIKLHGREQEMMNAFGTAARERARMFARETVAGQTPRYVGEVAVIGALLLLAVVSTFIEHRDINETLPIIGIFVAASLRILPGINRLVSNANLFRQSFPVIDAVYADRVAIAAARAKDASHDGPGKPLGFNDAIRLHDVTFAYPEAPLAPAIRSISLTFRRGEALAFTGASGAGKTTLIDVLLGLLPPAQGRVTVDGIDIRSHLRSWQAAIGYVPQQVALFDTTLRQNIALGIPAAEIDDARVRRAADLAQLSSFIARLPAGLETIIGERGAKLSGGQRQRIGVARALYHDPAILVLDEATSALDAATEDELSTAIEGLKGEKTVIVIAHRLSTVRRCDRVFVLDGGRLLDEGTFDELLSRNETFRHWSRLSGLSAKTPASVDTR
jgi:ATP-binding cassette, subfamily B, bacterial PglK